MKHGIAAALAALTLAACGSGQPPAGSPPHHTADGYQNLYPFHQPGLGDILRWRWEEWTGPEVVQRPERIPRVPPDLAWLAANRSTASYTWLGHASGLLQLGGQNVLIDPIFSERVSPVQWLGPRRYLPVPATLAQLPRIDVVLISHNHFDHLDRDSIDALLAQPGGQPQFVVPLGIDAWLRDRGATRITALDWWQSADLGGLQYTATPAQHWSKRSLSDTNETLWAGWAVKGQGKTVWYSGDTGYQQALFADIGRRLGTIDLALLPVGAYLPRWFMASQHVDPLQSVQMFRDVKARQAVGIHWGVFALASEAVDAPLDDLPAARRQLGVSEQAFRLLPLGGTLRLP